MCDLILLDKNLQVSVLASSAVVFTFQMQIFSFQCQSGLNGFLKCEESACHFIQSPKS